MKSRIPLGWPIEKGAVTCRTCHDITVQMYENAVQQKFNKNFLRQQPVGMPFCFTCHDKEKLRQENPHRQFDEMGVLNKAACLNCHIEVPDPARAVSTADAPLKADGDLLCIGCHGRQQKGHPARSDHLVKLSAAMRQVLSVGTALLLRDGSIHCTTCHNPHDKGVLKRNDVSAGAGEKNFLRLPGGYELCVACHNNLKISDRGVKPPPESNIYKAPAEVLSPHKPWAQNRCKACHAVTLEHREKPQPSSLCFRQGCHDMKIVNKPYDHELSVLRNCYFCHENHASEYTMLLRSNEERICYTCHPLLRDKKNSHAELSNAAGVHKSLTDYVQGLPIGAGNECNFCHSPNHKARISTIATGMCADCHISTRRILTQSAGTTINAHDGYIRKKCSACHDPHAGPYQYQLKEPVENYEK